MDFHDLVRFRVLLYKKILFLKVVNKQRDIIIRIHSQKRHHQCLSHFDRYACLHEKGFFRRFNNVCFVTFYQFKLFLRILWLKIEI